MANPAFPRPDMPGPQPIEGTNVTSVSVQRTAPLLHVSGGEVPDRIFRAAMTACALAVLAVLVLIVYELLSGSSLSWHAFGFKFFAGSDCSTLIVCRPASLQCVDIASEMFTRGTDELHSQAD